MLEAVNALLPYQSESCSRQARYLLSPWQAKRVRDFIDATLDEQIFVGALAGVAGISASHFFRVFKGTFGLSPHAYIIRRRISRAKDLMTTTEEPLSQIAAACGLTDQAHLSRLFLKEVGRPPGTWRREVRGGIMDRDVAA
jgi:AraC-like DNA-binding protein